MNTNSFIRGVNNYDLGSTRVGATWSFSYRILHSLETKILILFDPEPFPPIDDDQKTAILQIEELGTNFISLKTSMIFTGLKTS